MAKLTILRGAPGCGKSTIAKELGGEIVNRDTIRELEFGDAEFFGDEGLVTAIQDAKIAYHLSRGRDVVVDNTNCRWDYVLGLAALGLAAKASVVIRVVDVPLDEVLRRNATRGAAGGRQVPEGVIRKYHAELEKTKHYRLSENYNACEEW